MMIEKSPPPAQLLPALAAMMLVVATSNYLVQFPLNHPALRDWLTWGAFTYPFSFLVTDLVNRLVGAQAARRVVYAGFGLGIALSVVLATPRIALASGSAFLFGQLLDITVFNLMRQKSWWKAPLLASALGSLTDTLVFFSLAFIGSGLPWQSWAMGDLMVKLGFALLMLAPFRMGVSLWQTSHAR